MVPLETTFLTLIAENRQRILRLCRVYAKTAQDREDLYQDVLFQIWRALPTFNGHSHANTWLYRIALNTAIGAARKSGGPRRGVVVANDARVRSAEGPGSPAPEPEVGALYDAIARLDTIERALVTLFLEDLTYAEIGSVLGLSVSHVGVMLHRAKKKLLRLMQREEVSP
jgi:RNA polymerase sigma-70 factor (ECF subfamily)